MKELKGLIAAMATPFDENEELNLSVVGPLCDRLIADGADGIFCAGSMGECASMTIDERVRLAHATVEAVAGRVPVIAGVGDVSTKAAVSAVKQLNGSGVDFISCVMPYYLKVGQEELFAHMKKVIDASDIPVMAYNIPGNTGTDISAEMIGRLYRECGLAGAKDSSGDFNKIKSFIDATDEGFSLICGSDPLILDALKYGAKGAISAPANALTRIVCAIYDRFMSGDADGAREAQNDWMKYIDAFQISTFPGNFKRAAVHYTVNVGNARSPILPPDEKQVQEAVASLETVFRKYYPDRAC